MQVFRCPIGTEHSSYQSLKSRHVVGQGWSKTGDMSFLAVPAVDLSHDPGDYVRAFLWYNEWGGSDYNNLCRIFSVMREAQSGDIFIATEGAEIVGICELPERFTYVYANDDEYANCLFPVNWVDWPDFCRKIPTMNPRQGPFTHVNQEIIYSYVQKFWDEYKKTHNINLQPPECERKLAEVLRAQPKRIAASLEAYDELVEEMETEEMNEEIDNRNRELVEQGLNVVFTGAPGTGKTYLARKIAKEMTEGKDKHILNVQFHPSYGYSDFVEGLRPVKKEGEKEIVFERRDGVFMEFCRKAIEHKDGNFVVVIDEINRGDISKIFGELFSLIEVDYRTFDGRQKDGSFIAVKTQYNNLMDEKDKFKNGFFVPPNVYIIGTMNDVDRSVESMDFAIRRRFVWHEVTPEERFDAMWGEDNVQGVERETVKARMRALNEKIRNDQALGEAYQIGPEYFKKLKDLNGDYESLWSQSLRLLLKEYLRGIPDAQTKLGELHSVLVKAPTE